MKPQQTFAVAEEALARFAFPVEEIVRKLGDLRSPYRSIAPRLVTNLRQRIISGQYGVPGKTAKQVRKIKGQRVNGPALKASGALIQSIQRIGNPPPKRISKRKVFTLRIGSYSPYATDQLLGEDWEVPIRELLDEESGETKFMYIDPDRISGAVMTSEQYWGKKWSMISELPTSTSVIQVPVRDFLSFQKEDYDVIELILLKFLDQVFRGKEFEAF